MHAEDYGLWFFYLKATSDTLVPNHEPIETETTLKYLPWSIDIKYQGKHVCNISRDTHITHFSFQFHDPKFKTLSRSFTFKEDLSNQPLLKVLKRAIKRYQSAVKNAPGHDKSPYGQDLSALLEVICSWKNTDSLSK